MVEAIPHARLATVEGAGHGVPYDAPQAFEAELRAFLRGLGYGPPTCS
jgi:pimeloyl-ACP methyl ester carboxylesterase